MVEKFKVKLIPYQEIPSIETLLSVQCIKAEDAPIAFEMTFPDSGNPEKKYLYRYYQGTFYKNFITPQIREIDDGHGIFNKYSRYIELKDSLTIDLRAFTKDHDDETHYQLISDVLLILNTMDSYALTKQFSNAKFNWKKTIKSSFLKLINISGELYIETHEPHIRIRPDDEESLDLVLEITDEPMSGCMDEYGVPINAYALSEKDIAATYAHDKFWTLNDGANDQYINDDVDLYTMRPENTPLVLIKIPELMSTVRQASLMHDYLILQRDNLCMKNLNIKQNNYSSEPWSW